MDQKLMLNDGLCSQCRSTSGQDAHSGQQRRRAPLDVIDSLMAIMSYGRGQEIYTQGDPIKFWYRVSSGAVGKCALTVDGRRQIVDLLMSGDFFGFAAGDGEHHFSVEALVDGTIVGRYPRQIFERLAEEDPQVGRLIREMAFRAIARLEARMLIVRRVSATEKVGSFLVHLTERSHADTAGTVVLPMSRYDIADYLGLSVETVSRALTELKACGVIRFVGVRRVKILNSSALEGGNENGIQLSTKGA